MSKPMLDFIYQSVHKGLNVKVQHTLTLPPSTTWEQAHKMMTSDNDDRAGWTIRHLKREWPAWAWPGGYPIYYVTRDNGVLSAKSANENLQLTLGDDPQWEIVAAEINYEDADLFCDHSGERIPSAYAEPEEADHGKA